MDTLRTWFKNLSRVGKVSALSVVALSGLFGASAMSPPPEADQGSESTIESSPSLMEKKEPVVTYKTEVTTEPIAFKKIKRNDSNLEQGKSYVEVEGVKGTKTTTAKITMTDGVETDRITSDKVTKRPISQVTVVGTYVPPVVKSYSANCDSNYTGCVPVASDVDCAGGSGNGPAYVSGPIQVVGYDIYGLDRNGDGIACE